MTILATIAALDLLAVSALRTYKNHVRRKALLSGTITRQHAVTPLLASFIRRAVRTQHLEALIDLGIKRVHSRMEVKR